MNLHFDKPRRCYFMFLMLNCAFVLGAQEAHAQGISLPYSGTFSTSADVFSVTNNGSGIGIYAASAGSDGIQGISTASGHSGVYGDATQGYGVYGNSYDIAGVYGVNLSSGDGVLGYSSSGPGIIGETYSSAAGNMGVEGINYGSGNGVVGASSVGGTAGVFGTNGNTGTGVNYGVYGVASTYGVYGTSGANGGIGVYGINTDTTATQDSYGVMGQANIPHGAGVYGVGGADSSGAFGVEGYVGGTSTTPAVYGYSQTTAGIGVEGYGPLGVDGVDSSGTGTGVAGGSNSGYGVYGTSVSGYAGYFQGNVKVTGTITTTGKYFLIDHPADPANKLLRHMSIESDEMKNLYDGIVTTDSHGGATVRLPKWFEALNGDFRYQLTVIGDFAQAIVSEEIQNGAFSIRTSKPNVKVSWLVTGVRHDAWAKAHPMKVEEDKAPEQRGKYLDPASYGLPEDKGVDFNHNHFVAEQPKTPVKPKDIKAVAALNTVGH